MEKHELRQLQRPLRKNLRWAILGASVLPLVLTAGLQVALGMEGYTGPIAVMTAFLIPLELIPYYAAALLGSETASFWAKRDRLLVELYLAGYAPRDLKKLLTPRFRHWVYPQLLVVMLAQLVIMGMTLRTWEEILLILVVPYQFAGHLFGLMAAYRGMFSIYIAGGDVTARLGRLATLLAAPWVGLLLGFVVGAWLRFGLDAPPLLFPVALITVPLAVKLVILAAIAHKPRLPRAFYKQVEV